MSVRSVTPQEVAFFHENGWVYLPEFVDPATTADLRAQADVAWRAHKTTGEFGEHADRAFVALRGKPRDSAFARDVVTSPIMGESMVRLLEVPEVRLWADGYLLKQPESAGAQDETLYHQDFPGNPIDRSSFLSIWLATHDMPPDMGTMRFYNRSHLKGVCGQVFADGIDLRKRCSWLRDEDLSPPLTMRAGDATAHHSLTVHGAPSNTTTEQRWAYNMLYMDADSRYTCSPGLFPAGVTLEPFGKFEHPLFPIIPSA